MNYIIKSYGESLNKFDKNLKTILYKENNIYKINYYNLSRFMRKLSKYELELFKNSYLDQTLMNHEHIISKKNKDFLKIEEIRNNQKDYNYFNNFNLINYLDENNNINKDNISKVYDILLTYKYDYYNYYLKNNNTILIDNMLENYMNGIDWTLNYYFNTNTTNILNAECLNWNWYYKFQCIPFISDISNYLRNNYNKNFHIEELNNNKPLTFKEQLLYIIPLNNLKYIDNELYEILLNNKFLSPDKFNIDTIHKNILWCCHCLVPLFDNEYIRNII